MFLIRKWYKDTNLNFTKTFTNINKHYFKHKKKHCNEYKIRKKTILFLLFKRFSASEIFKNMGECCTRIYHDLRIHKIKHFLSFLFTKIYKRLFCPLFSYYFQNMVYFYCYIMTILITVDKQ